MRVAFGMQNAVQNPATFSSAGTMRCDSGRYSISSVYGNGVSKPVTRSGGASKCKNARSVMSDDELRAEAARPRCFVHDDEHGPCFFTLSDDRVDVDRPQRSKVEDLAFDPLLLRPSSAAAMRLIEHRAPRDDRDGIAFPFEFASRAIRALPISTV